MIQICAQPCPRDIEYFSHFKGPFVIEDDHISTENPVSPFEGLFGPTSAIQTVHNLELVLNINHVKNQVDQRTINIISK